MDRSRGDCGSATSLSSQAVPGSRRMFCCEGRRSENRRRAEAGMVSSAALTVDSTPAICVARYSDWVRTL